MDYTFFVSHLKIHIARKNFFFDVIVNEKVLKFIDLLYRLNHIRRYVRLTAKRYRIYTAWNGHISTLNSIRIYRRAANPVRISLRALMILTTHTYASHLVLNTPKGLMTHREAIRRRVGGILVAIVN